MRNATPVLPFKTHRSTRRHYFLRVNLRLFSFFTRTTHAKINPDNNNSNNRICIAPWCSIIVRLIFAKRHILWCFTVFLGDFTCIHVCFVVFCGVLYCFALIAVIWCLQYMVVFAVFCGFMVFWSNFGWFHMHSCDFCGVWGVFKHLTLL